MSGNIGLYCKEIRKLEDPFLSLSLTLSNDPFLKGVGRPDEVTGCRALLKQAWILGLFISQDRISKIFGEIVYI